MTNNNGYCTLNAQCFNYCDAEDGVGGHETLYGLSTDNLVCFSGAACAGGLVKCGSHDGDCQYDPGSANECDDYSEGSAVGSTGYCDSNCGYHAKGTYKFYVKDSGGGNIASFDDAGNVVITGTLNEGEWLSGWDKRIKLTIDGTKVDEFLTWFPITVFLNSTQGEGIFDELDEDSDYMKVAFTDSDGLWQLYAEKELFDVSEQKAIYHISRDGWGIYSAEDMDIYMYYNNDHADNTDYVGAINTAAGAAVWDGNYKAVYHMVDATTSTVLDSTSNNNDGIKKGANEPVETIGQVGLGQDFDGSDDYINSSTNFEYSDITVEGFVNYDLDDARYDIISEHAGTGATSSGWGLFRDASDETMYWSCAENSNWHSLKGLTSLNAAGGWYYLAGVFDNTNNDQILYLNDGPDATNNSATHSIAYTVSTNANIGQNPTGNNNLNGQLDEIRISNIARSAAWIKATYNSLEDTLLTYENEETNIPSGNDDFIIQNSTGDWVAWIDGATGNMYLAGTMLDGQAISPPANSFIIQNSGGTAVSYIDSNGNLRLSGAFIEGGTP